MKESQETGRIRQVAATELPTRWGVFRVLGFERQSFGRRSPETAIVLVLGDPSNPHGRHSFGFTPSVSRVMCFDRFVATAETNWNWRCEPSPRKDAVC